MAGHPTGGMSRWELWRPELPGAPAENMRRDEALLDEVARTGTPVLAVYTWRDPALSLGRFQPDSDVDAAACARRGVEVVRRPTGGRALLHGGDVTYAVAMPRPAGQDGTVDAVYCRLARGIVAGLARLGVEAVVATRDGEVGAACFGSALGSDIAIAKEHAGRHGGKKLCGSAQVHRGGAVLQHGSVLLDRLGYDEADLLRFPDAASRAATRRRLSESTVTLRELGVDASAAEVSEALVAGFAQALNLDFRSSPALLPPAAAEPSLLPGAARR